ncbi:MAG: pyridoxal phosphate-dependent transferase [Monoraphidium minutum]|nr:MAG: pyridoxal phosphate-dependent transferase [Monoraphidium minutum]
MLAPGMRLGWAEAAPATLERLRSCAVLRSGGCIAPLASAVAHSTLELGLLQSHLEGHVRPTLASRCGAMAEELDRQLVPLGCAYRRPYGGYFIWLELPQQVDSHQLLELASARHGVRFAPGALSGGAPNAARLCFAFYSPPELRAAVGRLAAALQELLGAAGKAPPA